MFQTLLEATCDGDLFLSNNNHSNDDQDGISGCDSFGGDLDNATTVINQNTSAVVKNVCILQMLLKVCCFLSKSFLLCEKKQSKIFDKPVKTV